ncbi:MAG: F0F1 ATP synthase subunit A [Chloroflexi bacterium]|nr:F0F1 ATP synthase subunit A [Chloroflexota bacterium]
MDITQISPDEVVLWELGIFRINATIAFTWAVMGLLVVTALLITRRLTTGPRISRWRSALEALVGYTRDQIREIAGMQADSILPFVGTLTLFIGVSNFLAIVPGYEPPTSSLSTTTALALAVFVAVPAYGIAAEGIPSYLRHYIEPTWLMLPFRIISELSRTLALAVRLFGNVMSSVKIVAILLAIVPLLFPAVLSALGLLTGLIQAYIFAVLATVYIASGTRAQEAPSAGDPAGEDAPEKGN